MNFIEAFLTESLDTLGKFCHDPTHKHVMTVMSEAIVKALQSGNTLLIAGNGGSAGDAQHIAGEFISRLMFDRAPLAAIALTTDSSVMTATGNDYGYEHVFERQVLGIGRAGDVFLGISTSGRSLNVLRAFDAAHAKGLVCIGFAGEDAGDMRKKCSLLLEVPSMKTAIIQQIHITAAHVVCGLVERAMFPANT